MAKPLGDVIRSASDVDAETIAHRTAPIRFRALAHHTHVRVRGTMSCLAMSGALAAAHRSASGPRPIAASESRAIAWRSSVSSRARLVRASIFRGCARGARGAGGARFPSRPRGRGISRVRALKSFDPETATIEGLTPLAEICDAFVCKSSPAVEGSLRQVAADVCALREDTRSTAPYAPDVCFDDGARVFEGVEGFQTHTFVKDVVGNARAAVTRMAMRDGETGEIEWLLVGDAPGGAVDVSVRTTLTMNLITGRVVKHEERWDFSKCGGSAGAFLRTARVAAAAPKNAADAAAKAARSIDDLVASVDLGKEDEEVFVDPNDPMKFFTESNKPEDDYLNYALFVAALWLVFEGLKATQTLH